MKRQKENSLESTTWSELGKQNIQAKKVYYGYELWVLEKIGINHRKLKDVDEIPHMKWEGVLLDKKEKRKFSLMYKP